MDDKEGNHVQLKVSPDVPGVWATLTKEKYRIVRNVNKTEFDERYTRSSMGK